MSVGVSVWVWVSVGVSVWVSVGVSVYSTIYVCRCGCSCVRNLKGSVVTGPVLAVGLSCAARRMREMSTVSTLWTKMG